jgi:flagellar hook-associated protein 1 FlgK
LMTRQVDPAGRWQDIAFHLSEGLDTSEADPEGLGAIAAATRLSLTLEGLNGTASLTAEVESADLSNLGSAAVAQAMAAKLRGLGTVPTITGVQVASRPQDGTSVQILLGSQTYGLTMVDGEIEITGPEADRITAFFDDTLTLQVAATGGSLAGQILRLSSQTPQADATAFGLGLAGTDAGLTGRAVTAPAGPESFTFASVIDGVEQTLTFDWDGTIPVQIPSNEVPDLSLEFAASGTGIVARLVVPGSSGIADVRLRPSTDAHALGLVSADAEITLRAEGLRIASTGSEAVQLDASASSLVAERLSLRGLPNEELIVITTGSGARRIAAAFGEQQTAAASPASFEVLIVDGPARRVEIIDRGTGHSLATRNIGDDGQFAAYGMRFELVGMLETGDRFYVEANQDGTGDARNAVALFALGDRNARTGLGGFSAEFATLVTNTGAETRTATIAQSAAEARRDAAVELEAEFSGVNLDDEAARLLEQQQAYQALARVLRTAGDLLDTLLNAIS